MSKNGFQLDASDWESCALRTVPASLQNFWQSQTGRHSTFLPFVGAVWGRPGVPPTISQKMARSLGSYVSGLIAGSQPSKSDLRGFSKLLSAEFLLQIRPGFGPEGPFPNGPRRGFSLPAQGRSNGTNLLPKSARLGFGPEGPFPNDPRKGFSLPAQGRHAHSFCKMALCRWGRSLLRAPHCARLRPQH